jgi:type I restriction enzyme, S subunit
MAGEWIEEPFPKVIDFQEGPGIMAKDFRDEGVPLVRLSGLDRGGSVLSGCNYLDPEMVAGKWAHFALAKGDILLSTSASLGRIAVVGEDAVGAISYTGIIRMRPRDGRLIAPFIRYLLEGPDFQQQAEMVGVGSVIRHFGPMHLRQMSVKLPPPDEQRAIAHILGTLDDKIELNRRMNVTLEAMARALFKSWFVDFDPVRAKADGRESGLPRPLADLFPDSFEGSALREIPKGWHVGRFGDVAEQLRDQENPLSSPDALFHHFSIPAFDEGQSPKPEYGESIKSLKSRVPAGVILLSKLNPEIERVWMVDVSSGERAVCSTEFLVLRAIR